MQNFGSHISSYGVENHGIRNANTVYWHLTTPMLYEQTVRRREAVIAHLGPLVVRTGRSYWPLTQRQIHRTGTDQ
jgi:phosphoenolpyruvate carboxykinase (ATP)